MWFNPFKKNISFNSYKLKIFKNNFDYYLVMM